MRISRYLDTRAFCDEANELRATRSRVDDAELERLEAQRSLVPRMRLHYPDEIERRWWSESHENCNVGDPLEPDGPRWQAACELEELRRSQAWDADPSATQHPLDDPAPRFQQFVERPPSRPFVPWKSYRVVVQREDATPICTSDTTITYYSSWQLLQYAEVVDMGVFSHINLFALERLPEDEEIIAAPRSMSFMPMHAMRGFEEHANTLDAIIWFAEEAHRGYCFAIRRGYRRRLISDEESREIMRTRRWAADEAQTRHKIEPEQLLAAVRFLCGQWVEWHREGRPLIAGAYKAVAAQGVRLACVATGMTVEECRTEIGQVGGHFKPILAVIWPNWAADQREYARNLLLGYRRPTAVLQATFSEELVDRFLDFIERRELHGFYWRLESARRHSFKGNDYALEGLKGDVQGMSVVLEHIASELGARRQQLYDKFKVLWAGDPAVLRLLKNNLVKKAGQGMTIDLDWFEAWNKRSLPEQTAADLSICYAIRGGAHRTIEESNPLRLELMILIMLRAAVKTFEAATKNV